MRLNNKMKLAKYLLREQGEETEEELAAKLDEPDTDEEAADDGADATDEDSSQDQQAGEESEFPDEEELEADADEEETDEEEEPVETSTYDKIRLKDSLDDELEAVFQDFESDALKSNKLNQGITESKKRSSKCLTLKKVFLLEFSEPEAGDPAEPDSKEESAEKESSSKLDINAFAADVARLIKNYDSLIDMEAVIFNKAKQFLLDKYNDATYKEFKDVIIERHGIDFFEDEEKLEDPIAVGAKNNSNSL